MKIAYLVNHYPAISHSFIRRELLALERQGHEILRISLRGWASHSAVPKINWSRAAHATCCALVRCRYWSHSCASW